MLIKGIEIVSKVFASTAVCKCNISRCLMKKKTLLTITNRTPNLAYLLAGTLSCPRTFMRHGPQVHGSPVWSNNHRDRFRKLTFRALALRRSEWLL